MRWSQTFFSAIALASLTGTVQAQYYPAYYGQPIAMPMPAMGYGAPQWMAYPPMMPQAYPQPLPQPMPAVTQVSMATAAEPAAPLAPAPAPAAAPEVASCPSGNCGGGSTPAVDCSDPCKKKWCLEGGGGVYLLRPHWDNNTAFATASIVSGVLSTNNVDFSHDYNFAPVAWLGISSASGLGFRSRHFWLDADADPIQFTSSAAVTAIAVSLLPGNAFGPGRQVAIDSNLSIYATDNEVTQRIDSGNWSATLAGGVRYAHVAQTYTASGRILALSGLLTSGHNFDGVGPTGAIELNRRLGNSGVTLLANLRGSLLYGSASQSAANSGVVFGPPAQSQDSWRAVVSVAEYEIGAEYARTFGSLQAFVQTTMVGQTWFSVGNAANVEQYSPLASDEINDPKGTLGLFGLHFSTGIRY